MPEHEDPIEATDGETTTESQTPTFPTELQQVMDQVVRAGHARAAAAQEVGGRIDTPSKE